MRLRRKSRGKRMKLMGEMRKQRKMKGERAGSWVWKTGEWGRGSIGKEVNGTGRKVKVSERSERGKVKENRFGDREEGMGRE